MDKQLLELINFRILVHYKDMPGFCIADAYKLIYQGCMGSEHAITSPDAVKQWLDKEWEELQASTHEGLYSDVSIHIPIYRINLRAAKAFGITKDQILEEFIDLVQTFPKRPDLLRQIWAELTAQIKAGKDIVNNPHELEEFNRAIEKNDFPAVHHSPEYRKINKPAYRLVDEIIG